MGYRNPNKPRMNQQYQENMYKHAGHTATWRHQVSASASASVVGLGTRVYYTERTITGVFGQYFLPEQRERQTPAGQIAAGEFGIVTHEQLARRDEIIWRGTTYRVDSDPTPVAFNGQWVSKLVRGSGT